MFETLDPCGSISGSFPYAGGSPDLAGTPLRFGVWGLGFRD